MPVTLEPAAPTKDRLGPSNFDGGRDDNLIHVLQPHDTLLTLCGIRFGQVSLVPFEKAKRDLCVVCADLAKHHE